MAFARHNIEKNRLIEMVRQNPILWDCRLPHYKRSDKKKQIKWCELGRAFNVSGERVQRTFTSLRELFRRELNHEKLFGARFTSKWEYYGAMSFLKDVIRERKTRDNSDIFNKDMIDEHSNFTKPSKTAFLSPEVIINDSPVLHEISSSGSSTPSISMKEEPTDNDDHDDEEGLKKAPISNKRRRRNKHTNMPNTENMWSKSGSAPSTSNHQGSSAIKYNQPSNSYQYSKRYSDNDEDYMQRDEDLSKVIFKPTPREILYTKFGEFLSAQLNVLNETVANELMNKILLLVAENR